MEEDEFFLKRGEFHGKREIICEKEDFSTKTR